VNAKIATVKSGGTRIQDEALLVAAAKSGDHEAFKLLVDRHRRMVLLCIMRLIDNREDAEDVVQQCLQKAFVHLKQFQGRSSFSTWLTKIARNEALMLLRNGRGGREISIDESSERSSPPTEVPDSGPNPEDICSQSERQHILMSIMSELKPPTRAALRFCDLDERPVREAAHILGLSLSAAKARVSRGRKVLREKIRRFHKQGRMNQWKGP
jgi:RNA polymerase sigma-70 factor (ECF subfamily)